MRLMLFQLLTDVNAGLRCREREDIRWHFLLLLTYVNAAPWELSSHFLFFISFDHNGTKTRTHIVRVRKWVNVNRSEWSVPLVFHPMSTSDQPAVIEPNKLNLRGSDASPSLSVWISLSLMRSGSRPVPVVSLEGKKVGTVHSEANSTNLTASLSASTTAVC